MVATIEGPTGMPCGVQNRGVDRDNVSHRDEGGNAGQCLAANGGVMRIEFEIISDPFAHLHHRLLPEPSALFASGLPSSYADMHEKNELRYNLLGRFNRA
jgi:hypothetical protein